MNIFFVANNVEKSRNKNDDVLVEVNFLLIKNDVALFFASAETLENTGNFAC